MFFPCFPVLQGSFMWVNSDQTLLFYTAHYDHESRSIQFLGFEHRYVEPSFRNLVCLQTGRKIPTALGIHYNISALTYSKLNAFDSVIYSCPVVGYMVPRTVLLAYEETTEKPRYQFARIKVAGSHYKRKEDTMMKFLVCVRPMPVGFGDRKRFIEFIEVCFNTDCVAYITLQSRDVVARFRKCAQRLRVVLSEQRADN